MTVKNENPKEVNIILNQSTSAKIFEFSNIIHKAKFYRVKTKIENFVQYDLGSEYSHNTITLLGTRGSGKTSFLLSLKSTFKIHEKVEVLDLIDPTLIEEKGHVFLNLISIICDKVDSKLKKVECSPTKNVRGKRKDWRVLVTKLAAGLPSIDGVSKSSELKWENPEYVMENELKSVQAARKLAYNFGEFLDHSLKILDKKAFLVLFDDIDVDSTKGYAVLETIRKYFTTGKIITVLSGDLRLYNTLIRQKKWNNFGEEIIKYEGSASYNIKNGAANMAYYTDMVTDLTSQYLLKIMQPQHRYHLSTLYELLNSSEKPIVNITNEAEESSMELSKVLLQIFNGLGINSRTQVESQIHFLLNQPLRTIIHFLQQIMEINGSEFIISERFDVLSILLTDLYEKHVNTELLTNSPLFLNIEIIKLLIREGQLKELYQLSPTSGDNSLNASVFAFNIIFSQTVTKHKFLIFDYFVRVSFLRNIIDYYPNGFSLNSGIVKISGVQNDLVLRDIMNQLQISFYAKDDKKDSNSTLIRLRGLKGSAKKSGMEDSLDAVLGGKDVNDVQRILGYAPTLAGSSTSNNNTRIFYSINSLMSCIGEILKRYEINKESSTVLESLIEFSQLRYYTIDDNSVGSSEPDEALSDFEENPVDDRLSITDDLLVYSDLVEGWLSSSKFNNISVHLLGKSFTRFYIAITNINRGNKIENLGRLFHLNILGLLNSILVEDVRENLPSHLQRKISINQNNVATSGKILIDNLKALKIEVEKKDGATKYDFFPLYFSKWFFSCPILLSYIDNSETELLDLIKEFTEVKSFNKRFNMFSILESVSQFSSPGKSVTSVTINKKSRSIKTLDMLMKNSLSKQPVDVDRKVETDSKDWKYDWTLSLETNFGKLLSHLVEDKINIKELFYQPEGTYKTGKQNKVIKSKFPLFGNDDDTAGRIRAFRNFLERKNLI